MAASMALLRYCGAVFDHVDSVCTCRMCGERDTIERQARLLEVRDGSDQNHPGGSHKAFMHHRGSFSMDVVSRRAWSKPQFVREKHADSRIVT